ncbi:hypothetical protein A1O3_05282 [Capronia epimyces CBS 606.96]|uniref:Uncharacterized protein n=1 Tax=Capronia epimyces CBS 606.96 TaxID=1182542 RepID=W9XVL8_9EURO|nr:uncharacterized protein A1O3_05282 [Capronia epimyces CBS 606.96]EXJ84612.1 hypothetical protein A1O3_05282 [Capronia epimyces CBS 606.96]
MTSPHSPVPPVTGFNAAQNPGPSLSTSQSQPCPDNVTGTQNTVSVRPPTVVQGQSNDDRAYQEGVRLSLQDQNRTHSTAKQGAELDNLIFSLNNEFPLLDDPEGDTVIYLGPPPKMPEQTDKEYQYIVNHFDHVYVVKSTTLRLMGESSRFNDRDLLGPKSVRTERILRKLGILAKAEAKKGQKFKYHIDLRPPNEGDEAVFLLTELTCSRGVLTWHLAFDKYGLPPLAVSGHDGYGDCPQAVNDPSPSGSSRATTTKTNVSSASHPVSKHVPSGTEAAPPVDAPLLKIGPEYSPIRHWSAIERLLHAIHGNDPKLDSAAKVWTYFAIARYFRCAHHERVSGWITAWIYENNNVDFIQNNPEVAYRMGMGIRSSVLVQDAFSILVGERALTNVLGEFNPAILSPLDQSVHGRKLELLGDDERNRIDHAAASFVTRIRGVVHYLCQDMGWLLKCRSYALLNEAGKVTPTELELLESTKHLVKEYIRSRIYYVLCQDQGTFSELEGDPESTLPFRPSTGEHYHSVYNSLNQPMRMFTKTFWLALQRTDFGAASHNTTHKGTVGIHTNTSPYIDALRELCRDDPENRIKPISRSTLDKKIAAVNRILWRVPLDEGTQARLDLLSGFGKIPERHAESTQVEAIPSGIPKHSFDRSEHSSPDVSLAKRRKTLESKDMPQNLPSASRTSLFSASQDRSPVKSRKTSGLNTYGNRSSPMPKDDQPAVAHRPKQKGVLENVRTYVQNHISRPSEQADEDQEPLMHQIRSTSGPQTHAHSPEPSVSDVQSTNDASGPEPDPPTAGFPIEPTTAAVVEASHSLDMQFNAWKGIWEDWGTPEKSEKDAFMAWGDDPTNTTNTTWTLAYPISPATLLHQVNNEISNLCSTILYPSHLFHQSGLLPTNLFDNLLCLDANEFRYLPLWNPDGLDDGSGGVFDECPVPNLDPLSSRYEPFAAGRIRAPYDQDQNRETDSEFTDIASEAISTVGKASKLATDGTETVKSLSSISLGESARGDGDDDGETVVLSCGLGSVVQGLHDMEITRADNERDTAVGMSDDDVEAGDGVEDKPEDDDGLYEDDDDDDYNDGYGGDDDTNTMNGHQETSTTLQPSPTSTGDRGDRDDFEWL